MTIAFYGSSLLSHSWNDAAIDHRGWLGARAWSLGQAARARVLMAQAYRQWAVILGRLLRETAAETARAR